MVGSTIGKIKSEEVLAPDGVPGSRPTSRPGDPKGLPGKELFQQRAEEGDVESHAAVWRKCPPRSRNSRETAVAGAEGVAAME